MDEGREAARDLAESAEAALADAAGGSSTTAGPIGPKLAQTSGRASVCLSTRSVSTLDSLATIGDEEHMAAGRGKADEAEAALADACGTEGSTVAAASLSRCTVVFAEEADMENTEQWSGDRRAL